MELNTSTSIIPVDPYQDQLWMKPVATFFYALGLICCIFLGCVVWFERTKKFAPHRTLTQQMTSYSLILVRNNTVWKLQDFILMIFKENFVKLVTLTFFREFFKFFSFFCTLHLNQLDFLREISG